MKEDVETVLAQWRADEARIRSRATGPGVAMLEDVSSMSGLEILDAILAGRLPTPHICHTLDFLLIEGRHGHALFQGRPQLKHYNPLGGVHGGWYATLLDSAVGCAVHTTLPAGKGYTTLELKLNMVRGLTEHVPLVRAEGKIIHAGRQVATADGRLYGPDGTLYAHASTTCLVFDAKRG